MLTDCLMCCAFTAGSCAKQSYKAIVAPDLVNITCDSGLVLMDHTGGYKCVAAPEKNPCSAGFSSEDELVGGVFARCKQVRAVSAFLPWNTMHL